MICVVSSLFINIIERNNSIFIYYYLFIYSHIHTCINEYNFNTYNESRLSCIRR